MKQIIRTNRFLASVVTLMGLALLFTMDVERLLSFYADPILILFVIYFAVINPALIFFGFSVHLTDNTIEYRSYLFFVKAIKYDDISHVLYQPTWRNLGIANARTLNIVRKSGGWKDTISINAGLFTDIDVATVAKTLMLKALVAEFDDEARKVAEMR